MGVIVRCDVVARLPGAPMPKIVGPCWRLWAPDRMRICPIMRRWGVVVGGTRQYGAASSARRVLRIPYIMPLCQKARV